jgi:hypothetical protein
VICSGRCESRYQISALPAHYTGHERMFGRRRITLSGCRTAPQDGGAAIARWATKKPIERDPRLRQVIRLYAVRPGWWYLRSTVA